NMPSSKDNALREGYNRRRGTRRGKELANEKRKHCTRSGLTLIVVEMMVCVRVCMYEWCSRSVSESERNRTGGSAGEQKGDGNIKSPMHFGSNAIDKGLCR
ncbi:hypothetical protein PV326_014031, partial [Microctonus aethiopoides]